MKAPLFSVYVWNSGTALASSFALGQSTSLGILLFDTMGLEDVDEADLKESAKHLVEAYVDTK